MFCDFHSDPVIRIFLSASWIVTPRRITLSELTIWLKQIETDVSHAKPFQKVPDIFEHEKVPVQYPFTSVYSQVVLILTGSSSFLNVS